MFQCLDGDMEGDNERLTIGDRWLKKRRGEKIAFFARRINNINPNNDQTIVLVDPFSFDGYRYVAAKSFIIETMPISNADLQHPASTEGMTMK